MQTHRDDDHVKKSLEAAEPGGLQPGEAEAVEKLHAHATVMTGEGSNRITAGKPGETPLQEARCGAFHIRQMPDDPDSLLRISIGSVPVIEGGYFVFRGHPNLVHELLSEALDALEGSSLMDVLAKDDLPKPGGPTHEVGG